MRTIISAFMMIITIIALIPIFALMLPIWLFVNTCYWVEKIWLAKITAWSRIVRFDSEIGWTPRSDLHEVLYSIQNGDLGTVSTCKNGWPGEHTLNDSDVVVFGDSFAFGFGVKQNDAYYNLGQDISIKPIAAPGYNMAQAILLMRKYRRELAGKTVIWLVCLENDLAENIRMDNCDKYTVPFVRKNPFTKKWEIMTDHLLSRKWLYGENKSQNTLRYATICTESEYANRVYEVCNYLINEAKQITDSAGAKLLILTIPDKRQLSGSGMKSFTRRLEMVGGNTFNPEIPDKRLEQICHKYQISFIAGADHLNTSHYKVRDGHWNVEGNQIVSELIEEFHNEGKKTPFNLAV